MKTMLIVFFILIFLLMILLFPFKSRIMGHLNLIEKKGYYSFKVWRIKLLCGMVWLDEDNRLRVENTSNKIKDRYKDEFTKKLTFQIMKKINVDKVELFFVGGFCENSFSSAMLCASAKVLTDMIYAYLSQRYFDVKLYEDVSPTFNKDSFELTFDFVASMSIFQIISAMFNAKNLMIKEQENG